MGSERRQSPEGEGVVDTMELVFEIVFFTLAIPAFIADVLAG
jgi:hypothetical protein